MMSLYAESHLYGRAYIVNYADFLIFVVLLSLSVHTLYFYCKENTEYRKPIIPIRFACFNIN